jgi:hypothetical protein
MRRTIEFGLLILCGIGFVATCTPIQAQGVSPVIQEFNKKARGVVQVTNVGDAPKTISCWARGFDADEHGTLQLHPLDDTLQVQIDAGREVVTANGSRRVSFHAVPATLPAWFVVTCQFVPIELSAGLTMPMETSSVVIVQGERLDSRDVTLSAKRAGAKVEVEVKNNGSELARVSSGQVLGHGSQADIGTFVLFPHQRRLVEADWNEMEPPEAVRIQIGKNSLEASIN